MDFSSINETQNTTAKSFIWFLLGNKDINNSNMRLKRNDQLQRNPIQFLRKSEKLLKGNASGKKKQKNINIHNNTLVSYTSP